MTVGEISRNVGIFSRTTFVRTFKKVEGIAPSEYRKLYKKA
jgi:two-component system response regulator YesN